MLVFPQWANIFFGQPETSEKIRGAAKISPSWQLHPEIIGNGLYYTQFVLLYYKLHTAPWILTVCWVAGHLFEI